MSLVEALADDARRRGVIDDCVALVDSEVQKKKGLGGAVIKTAYKAVKGIKPGFIRQVVDSLFDAWAKKLDPLWAEAQQSERGPRPFFESQPSRVAEALLEVTDAKSEGAKNAMVRGTYKKLRPSAKNHVEEAVPALAALLEKHVGKA